MFPTAARTAFRLALAMLIGVTVPVSAQAQEDESGMYEDAETMRADQAVIRPLVAAGGAALESGNWAAAARNCGDLNERLYNSPFMREPANKAASHFSIRCYADAQAKLGNIESACRVYANLDYTGLLEGLDRRALCRNSANPPPPTAEERFTSQSAMLGEQIRGMIAMNALLEAMPMDAPGRQDKLGEMFTLCDGIFLPGLYADLSKGVSAFCKAQWLLRRSGDPDACRQLNAFDANFGRVGTKPWPAWVPHRAQLDAMIVTAAEIRKTIC